MKNEETIAVIKEIMAAHKTVINAETKASADMLKLEIDKVIERQDRTNGEISKNSERISKNNDKIDNLCKQTTFVRWFARNPAFGVSLLILILAGVIFIISYFGFGSLFKLI